MIFDLLQPGEDNAKTAREIAKATGLNIRDVMQAIRAERLEGLPICGTCKGFFIPANDAELSHTISRLYKQARATRKVAEALKETRGYFTTGRLDFLMLKISLLRDTGGLKCTRK